MLANMNMRREWYRWREEGEEETLIQGDVDLTCLLPCFLASRSLTAESLLEDCEKAETDERFRRSPKPAKAA